MLRWLLVVPLLTGCVQGVTQVAGIGSTYTTRCSAEMDRIRVFFSATSAFSASYTPFALSASAPSPPQPLVSPPALTNSAF